MSPASTIAKGKRFMRVVAFFLLVLFSPGLLAATPPGNEVYLKHCSGCHEQLNERIPHREQLQKMPSARIVRALDSGAMMAVALTMSRDERLAVASYLGTNEVIAGPPASAYCDGRTVKISTTATSGWNGWSPGSGNTRFQSAEVAGLNADRVRQLKLKWAFGFEGDVTAFAPVTVLDSHLFVGSAAGVVHAMRAESGCLDWTYQADGPVRTAVLAAPLSAQEGGPHALLFGDMIGWFYSLQAETGKLLWKVRVETHDSTRLTGSPIAHDGVVYVPVSSWEETRANDGDYACCTFRGSLVALRIRDGRQLWKTHFVGEPKVLGKNAKGVPSLGPSGVAVWSTPTLDAQRNVIYVATGDNYSSPATDLSDAVVALDLSSGRIVWSKQVTENDIFNGSCGGDKLNCPEQPGPDHDFGSSVIPVKLPGGKDLLLAGQKSGVVYALDPDKRGEIVWQTRVGQGGTNGGVQWGMSTDGRFVYASVSDVARTRQTANMFDTRRYILDPGKGGGLTALHIADGSKAWYAEPVPCAEGAPAGCSPSQPGAVSGIPGVVFATSTDGYLRAHSSEDGKVLWAFNTMRDFETVNGAKARGGSIDGPGAAIANGMVFISSGYPRNGGVPGNVLLAFSAE
jgi:polyvinyl alcohol dehydrogenase (cytochrome)